MGCVKIINTEERNYTKTGYFQMELKDPQVIIDFTRFVGFSEKLPKIITEEKNSQKTINIADL